MRTEDLYIFNEVCRTGGINAASKELKMSQQNVSRRIEALEKSCGQRIFVRTHHGTVLTEFGKGFYRHSKKVLSAQEKLDEYIDSYVQND